MHGSGGTNGLGAGIGDGAGTTDEQNCGIIALKEE